MSVIKVEDNEAVVYAITGYWREKTAKCIFPIFEDLEDHKSVVLFKSDWKENPLVEKNGKKWIEGQFREYPVSQGFLKGKRVFLPRYYDSSIERKQKIDEQTERYNRPATLEELDAEWEQPNLKLAESLTEEDHHEEDLSNIPDVVKTGLHEIFMRVSRPGELQNLGLTAGVLCDLKRAMKKWNMHSKQWNN